MTELDLHKNTSLRGLDAEGGKGAWDYRKSTPTEMSLPWGRRRLFHRTKPRVEREKGEEGEYTS